MVGDHPIFDIQGAENAGITAIHVDYQQKFAKSKYTIPHIQHLKKFLI
jgi:FMN phosphatase YigB (HAD superfamily)